jgi:glycosyltransferase involved in cell wall biosynthesis
MLLANTGCSPGQIVAIIDADMAGGGTLYSSILAQHLAQNGFSLLHFRFNHRQNYLKLSASVNGNDITTVLPVEAGSLICDLISSMRVDHVIVNQLSTWPEPVAIMKWLSGGAVPYLVMTHDFFCLCPSWFLVNRNGDFCELPDDMKGCTDCLKLSSTSIHKEFYGNTLDNPARWRQGVGSFLAKAESVICFSNSTIGYIKQVYPALTNIVLNEHSIPYREMFVWNERRFDGYGTLHLAIIGHLFPVKGEKVVREMIESERFRSMPVTLKVFGDSPLYPPGHVSADGKVAFLGGYRREELPQLLERHGIHAVLISSILPETFSYTTSEAILLGYPVICFDLGAQAERVKRYESGLVAENITSGALMDQIAKLILNPVLLTELSRNCRNYAPVTTEKHFNAILDLVKRNS